MKRAMSQLDGPTRRPSLRAIRRIEKTGSKFAAREIPPSPVIDQLLDGDGRESRIDGLAWKRGQVETEPGKYRQAQFKLLCLQQLVDHRRGERLAHAREPKRTVRLRDRVVRLGPGVAACEQELALAGNGKRARAHRGPLQQSLHRGVKAVEFLNPRAGDRPPARRRRENRTRQQQVRHSREHGRVRRRVAG